MLAALDAGKHVLCEKPIAINLQEGREMYAAAEAAGVTAMIDFEFRFSPSRLHVEQLLAGGYVGDLRHANIEIMTESPIVGPDLTLSWHDQAAMDGGTINEHGSHYIDMVLQWFGEVRDVSARMHTFVDVRRHPVSREPVESDADDFWTCTMTLANGGIVTLTQSWVSGITQGLRVTIAGTKGALVVAQNETMLSDASVLGGKTGTLLEELPGLPLFRLWKGRPPGESPSSSGSFVSLSAASATAHRPRRTSRMASAARPSSTPSASRPAMAAEWPCQRFD